jgi:hypothetical protein
MQPFRWPCLLLLPLAACGSPDEPDEPKTCDALCRDEIAARSLREVVKLVYNLTLQGNPIGSQMERTDCPMGGEALVTGFATSVAEQGATEVQLTYELSDCAYLQRDDEVEENYDMVITGTVHEEGVMAVQPTATTALIFESSGVSLEGSVFDPPLHYAETDCDLRLVQDGQRLNGRWCGREIGFDL